uniref:J domain-containing protein n=1 Tax=Mycena chlorophos TaxID=658473 RepID=A0ABQ0KYS5_MYCCL|nr:predicted protein [Mycena chlorophos]
MMIGMREECLFLDCGQTTPFDPTMPDPDPPRSPQENSRFPGYLKCESLSYGSYRPPSPQTTSNPPLSRAVSRQFPGHLPSESSWAPRPNNPSPPFSNPTVPPPMPSEWENLTEETASNDPLEYQSWDREDEEILREIRESERLKRQHIFEHDREREHLERQRREQRERLGHQRRLERERLERERLEHQRREWDRQQQERAQQQLEREMRKRAEWARQAEAARLQHERWEQAMREQAERARQAEAARLQYERWEQTMREQAERASREAERAQQAEAELLERNRTDNRWSELEQQWSSLVDGQGKTVRLEHLPWPTARQMEFIHPATLAAQVGALVTNHGTLQQGAVKRRIRSLLLRWHPDKFAHFAQRRIASDHEHAAVEAAHIVVTCLNAALNAL